MASRKRQRSLLTSLRSSSKKGASRDSRRRNLVETLEQRQLLAGPQLIGIQPNEGDLIIDGTVRDVSPRLLTFRFDEDQVISSATTDAIRITRAGDDGALGTADDLDVSLPDGSVVVNSDALNEVLVRFPNALPDDKYRIEVFGFDDPGRGIVGLRNTDAAGGLGELLVPSQAGARKEQVDFELRLGALVEAVVPQPVVRLDDGTLQQNRDQIVVYFNEDELFVENDAAGNPTMRSVENPRFYQLLYTRDTVRTTDDDIYFPTNVDYDAESHTATLTFQDDISELTSLSNLMNNPANPTNETYGAASISGGTFRLRVGTAVDDRAELIIQPTNLAVVASASSDLLTRDAAQVKFISRLAGEAGNGITVRFERNTGTVTTARVENDRDVVVSLAPGADVAAVRDAMLASGEANALLQVSISGSVTAAVGEGIEFLPALQVAAVGDTFQSAFDVGTFGQSSATLTSLIVSESIDPQPYLLELLGGNDDPGHRELDESAGSGLRQHLSDLFTPDITAGITTIPYNFQTIYAVDSNGVEATNSISPVQKARVREALGLYAAEIGVQFTETANEGITFAVGDLNKLTGPNVVITAGFGIGVRRDPTFATSAVVLNSQIPFLNQYGESFFRTVALGIGDVLGLEQTGELPDTTLSTRSIEFINSSINQNLLNLTGDSLLPAGDYPGTDTELLSDRPFEPIFPGDYDILHAKYLYNPDSIDVDLYRFEVDLGDDDKVGLLTAETFAERQADSSLLDTTLTLYQQQQATVVTDFEVGTDLSVEFEAVSPALLGNRTQIEFAQVDRISGDVSIGIVPTSENSFRVEIPRQNPNTGLPVVTVGSILDAINNDPFAASLVTGRIVKGDASTDVGGLSLNFNPLVLTGGDLIELSRNDDYFSEDSRIRTSLGNGVYYVGVAASGNDLYDPTIPDSGFGGRSQGKYDLQLVFEAQVDEVDVIRDLDSGREGVPGVALDGDGDGVPGGVYNYWFQSRPLQRQLEFTAGGDGITPLSTVRVQGGQGVERVYQFVPQGSTGDPRYTTVSYRLDDSPAVLAVKLSQAINTNTGSTGVQANSNGTLLTLNNEREIDLSANFVGVDVHGKTIFVDKLAGPNADGTTARPFNNISSPDVANAFGSSEPGDIVRIVGNGGSDQSLTTEADNFAYEFGFAETAGVILEDGEAMEVPAGVTTMIDAGAVFRFRNSRISVGSSDLLVDRSGGAVQVLGTPRLLSDGASLTVPTAATGASLDGTRFSVTSNGTTSIFQFSTDPNRVTSDQLIVVAADADSEAIAAAIAAVVGSTSTDFVTTTTGSQTRIGSLRGLTPVVDPLNSTLTVEVDVVTVSDDGSVIFTSTRDRTAGQALPTNAPAAAPGDWGGLVFRSDFDDAQGRLNLEDEGIFLQYVNHADIRYGGGSNVKVGGFQQTVNPIQIIDTRPTVTFNQITRSAGAAMSAAPNSFEETSYQAPRYQQAGVFTSDYDRVGPDIHFNELVNNSFNALFIRVDTLLGSEPRQLTLSGRLDDTDVVHVLAENLTLAGTPGGPITDGIKPTVDLVNAGSRDGGTLTPGDYVYRVTFVDANGFESLASDATNVFTVAAGDNAIQLSNLPPTTEGYQFRRIYRASLSGPNPADFFLVKEIDASSGTFFDDGQTTEGLLDINRTGTRGRLDASLVFDPGLVTKLIGSRIELGQGAQILAEGLPGQEVVFTSVSDDRFGFGGTFDTNNNGNPADDAQAGDWGGIYVGPTAHVSLDNAVVAYGGGLTRIEGSFKAFNAIELQQGTGRITNTVFAENANGLGGQGPTGRFGRLANTPATIFVRGSQPTIVGNTFINNTGSVIDIDANSLVADLVSDTGRQTGAIDRLSTLDDNHGPLVRSNRYDNNGINGMEIRGATLTVESIWDDTDIVHVVYDPILVDNMHSAGGLRLQSRPDESLVVKFNGSGTPYAAEPGTGLTAQGTPLDIRDRVGGTLHVIGQPGFPVVLTSLKDDTIGAGVKPDGSRQTDTNNDDLASRPEANDWRGILLDEYSNDRNVETVLELESSLVESRGTNGTVGTAQVLGDLAPNFYSTDEFLRLGFTVDGYLASPSDVDVYNFTGEAGTVVWFDIDKTTHSLDTVIELLDSNGNVLARSDNSTGEVTDPSGIVIESALVEGRVGPLARGDEAFANLGVEGLYKEYGTTNIRDAGFRVALPGVAGSRSAYSFRIRSASVRPDDVAGGTTHGAYTVQLRLREDQEFGGSVIRYADIRYANHGIHMRGVMQNSPLLGDAQENEGVDAFESSNDSIVFNSSATGQRPQYLGNLLETDDVSLSVGGSLSSSSDVDFYKFYVDHTDLPDEFNPLQHFSTVFDVDYADGLARPDTSLAVFWDPDGEADGFFNRDRARLVLWSEDGNIAEDQTSPLGPDTAEIFDRGSLGTGDPFIGPMAVPATGVYYVAVVSDSQTPSELVQNPTVRLDPIPSVARIADDQIDTTGAHTADAPAVPILIPRTNLPVDWQIGTQRSSNPGHGDPQQFDNTDSSTDPGAIILTEFERNDPQQFRAQSLETFGGWNLRYDGDVGNTFRNTSLEYPWIRVRGTGDDTIDAYSFEVTTTGTVIIDVDEVSNGFTQVDETEPVLPVDLRLVLVDSTGAIVATDNGVPTFVGQGGSDSSRDPYIEVQLDPGTYTFAVGQLDLSINDVDTFTGTGVPDGTLYSVNVSVEGHDFVAGSDVNQALHFTPTAAGTSTFETNAFNLGNYTAQDEPYLYFNYYLDSFAGTSLEVNAVTDAGTFPLPFNFQTNFLGSFRQARISLADVVGQDNIRLQFVATASTGVPPGTLFPPLSLDDFVIGFAERGERVANASPGQDGFSFTTSTSSILQGEYQLEIRQGAKYSTSQNPDPQQVLTSTFDTNARLAPESVTLIAPEGRQLRDGDFFEIGDGANTVRFEFNSVGSVQLGSLPIPFTDTDPDYVVAQAIRNAINGPNVQAILNLEASSSGGIDNGASRDNRIDLVGPAEADFVTYSPQNISVSSLNDAIALADVVTGSGITRLGNEVVSAGNGLGTFDQGGFSIGLDSGLVLSTGVLDFIAGPNTSETTTGTASGIGDADLDLATGIVSADSASLAYDFELAGSTPSHIYLQAVFASEEYINDATTPVDKVAVLVTDTVSGDVMNLAVTAAVDPVDSTSIAPGSQLYNNNSPSQGGEFLNEFGMDGFSQVLTFSSEVTDAGAVMLQPGRRYNIKFVIGDGNSNSIDSALFVGRESLSTTAPADANRAADPATGRVTFQALVQDSFGDRNVSRVQSQIIIDSSTVSHSQAYGIWSEPATRKIDPTDALYDNELLGSQTFRNDFIQTARLGNTGMGAVRNLPTLNDSVVGGLAPGPFIVNNIVDDAQLAGINIQGEMRPWVIDPFSSILDPDSVTVPAGSCFVHHVGDCVSDGALITIDSGRTRVVFEFENIQSGPGGGGDGVNDGHIPIYYRPEAGIQKNQRLYGYNKHELLLSIREAILSSPLVQNDMVQLVDPVIANNVSISSPLDLVTSSFGTFVNTNFQEPALYLYGATSVFYTPGLPIDAYQSAVHEGVQPFARLVNNTIVGRDGTLSTVSGSATDESNDTIDTAVTTNMGVSHTPDLYTTTGMIGDNTVLSPNQDVDFFKVDLDVGDRLRVDVDTNGSVDTVLRVFNSSGQVVTFHDDFGNPLTLSNNAAAPGETVGVDPYVDYTATAQDTYYVAISAAGNNSYDSLSLGQRLPGAGTGAYDLSIEVLAPRQFLIDAQPGSAYSSGDTFVVYQIPDLPTGLQAAVAPGDNAVVFEFVLGGGNGSAGTIPINFDTDYTAADMALAIGAAINGVGGARLPNHAGTDLPDGRDGPIDPVTAQVLGGTAADDEFLVNFTLRPHHAGNNATAPETIGSDSRSGYGFDDVDTGALSATSSGQGETEHYVIVKRAAQIDSNGSIRLDPVAGRNNDQLIPEAGIIAMQGASPTLLNNVIINTNGAVINEETRLNGFGSDRGSDLHTKKGQMIVGGSVFQATESENLLFRTIPRYNANRDIGIEDGPTNTNTPTDDFNIVLNVGADSLVNPLGGDFLPVSGSLIIDSAIDSLPERSAFATLKQALGIAVSPVLAPSRDNSGQLRADDPNTQTPPGLGANVFKDRGALDLADFVGPVATLDVPKDNDAEGIDTDPAVSFLQLSDGSYSEFRIQLTDAGDASDPFPGSGINDDTVVGPDIPGLRKEGAAVTVFENGRLLTEGIDYSFTYDSTKNQIRLTPLAGIWRNDRSYRIQLNNEDRFVVVAPTAATITDGDQLTITDTNGGVVSLEFEAGYEIELPEVLKLIVPPAGTGAGGINDADRFIIDDGTNSPVVFEFDLATENNTLPGSVRVPYNQNDTAAELAASIANAIQTQSAPLDVDITVQGSEVWIGAESGAAIDAFDSGLLQASRTLALQPPTAGAGPGGIQDGESFTINDGTQTVGFEFDTGGGVQTGNVPVLVAGATQAAAVSLAIQEAMLATTLNATPTLVGDRLLLGLPADGSATAGAGLLRVVGLSQTPADGTTLTFTPTDGGPDVVFELNRSEPGLNNGLATPGAIGIDFTRATTADELAQSIASAIVAENIAGVDPTVVDAIGNGVVSVVGEPGLGLTTVGSASVLVTGEPGVAGFSNLQVFGPLEMLLQPLGGISIADNSQFSLTGNDQTVIFEYTQNGFTVNPTAIPIVYSINDAVDVIVTATVNAINAQTLGITATANPDPAKPESILLGQIDSAQVDLLNSGFTTQRGTVNDGDYVVISQGATSAIYEFNLAVGGGGLTQAGAVAVTFQAGSSTDVVASALAAAIRNNKNGLRLDPVANGDSVVLNDVPGTNVDVSNAPTLLLSGVPGQATPILVNRSFTSVQIKEAIIDAINRINDNVTPGDPPFTDVRAVDRGGNTLFVENAQSIGPQVQNYFLQSIADEAGRDLKPNRNDNTTQFTILMQEIALDFGDAPDPVTGVSGRYPTLFDADGARHVIGLGPVLGSLVDGDADGQPTVLADGDDTSIDVVGSTGGSFVVTSQSGSITVSVVNGVDGDTLTIDTGIARATFEFDTDGIFDEDNFAVAVQAGETVGQALERAFLESPLRPAGLVVNGDSLQVIIDDEDGVSFPDGVPFPGVQEPVAVFNNSPGFRTPISVTVTGTGILDAWVDFNGDGDWLDPGEKIIGRGITTIDTNGDIVSPLFVDAGQPVTREFSIAVPATTAVPQGALTTYARFRLSTEGDLNPTGLALSGEVEDYLVRVLPGQPPAVPANYQVSYDVLEDTRLDTFDLDGSTPPANNDSILVGLADPDGDPVAVYSEDLGPRRVENGNGEGGDLVLQADGTFSFVPDADFAGPLTFTARVTDVRGAGREGEQLVSPNRITVTLNVNSVNDPPVPVGTPPIVFNAALNEDQQRVFTAAELTSGLFSPGPANESGQSLIINTAGANTGPGGSFVPFVTEQGGSLQILGDGGSVRYTPPLDYNGSTPDRFVYTVEDVPTGAGELPEIGVEPGTVVISIAAVNDPPITQDDVYQATEDDPNGLIIPITGIDGILDNDAPGPADEVADGQTISLIETDFTGAGKTTQRGGTVVYIPATGNTPASLRYDPAPNYSGVDEFTYRIQDDQGATATGTVRIIVGGENDPADFIGIEGVPGVNSISEDESKQTPKVLNYDLSTWFTDPEGDPLTFSVTVDDPDLIQVQQSGVNGAQLQLTLLSYKFGNTNLRVSASNPTSGQPTKTEVIDVTLINTPDLPRAIGTLNELTVQEDGDNGVDGLVVRDLSTVFEDPDQTQLVYRVVSPANFANSPLVESITFVGDEMRIQLRPNANGSTNITIGATDDVNDLSREVTDSFTLRVTPVADAPTGTADFYNVSLGGRLSVQDVAQGVLNNDSSPDGDAFTLELVSTTTKGTLTLNDDGTFVYQNESGDIGETDQFTYRLTNAAGSTAPIPVTINLGRSAYQNPIPGSSFDVTADGFVAPDDVLQIINLLNRRGTTPVSSLTEPPPPYYDVDGNGIIEPFDSLLVINELNLRNRQGNRAQGEAVNARVASTSTFAAMDTSNLPQSNQVAVSEVEPGESSLEPVGSENGGAWQAEFVAVDNRVDAAVDTLLAGSNAPTDSADQEMATDSALSALFDEISVDIPPS